MKRALTGSAFVALLLGVVYAPINAASNDRAVVVKEDGTCGMMDGDGNLVKGDLHSVENSGGHLIYKCQAKKVKNAARANRVWDYDSTGWFCGTIYGDTADWRMQVTPSGNATLTCKIRK